MITIADKGFVIGSIKREKFASYNKRYLYRYRDVVADLVNGNVYVKDHLFAELLENDIIDNDTYKGYELKLRELFSKLPDDLITTDEVWYSKILLLREMFKSKLVEEYIVKSCKYRIDHCVDGINQSYLLENIDKENKSLFIFIDECKYLTLVETIYNQYKHSFKEIHIIVCGNSFIDSSSNVKAFMADDFLKSLSKPIVYSTHEGIGFDLKEYLVSENDLAIGFGEWCLGAFKNLNIDSYVCCESNEIITRGLTNAKDKKSLHFIYVPKHFDLVSEMSVVEKQILNYRVYDWLLKDYGPKIYDLTFDEVKLKYSKYFLCHDSDVYVDISNEEDVVDMTNLPDYRVKLMNNWVNGKYNDIHLDAMEIRDDYNLPMKVNSALIDNFKKTTLDIISYSTSKDIRKLFRESHIKYGLACNFLFFTTEKTIATYNNLRKNRKSEQFNESGWHVDYQKNENIERFPLYNKAMIAMTETGEITFARKKLTSGEITINGQCIQWSEEQVDTNDLHDFKLFTPMYYQKQSEDYMDDQCIVGEDRINMIIINDKVLTVRSGDVMLSSIGLVLSFTKAYFTNLFGNIPFNSDGYSDQKFDYTLNLDKDTPLKWAFGGGMFLINDYEKYDTTEKLKAGFSKEGWLNNLSKQTQDSETFRLDKHPRTAIGKTKLGQFFIIVCAGRSKHSVGADYFDLIKIANHLFDDVQYLMNVDGGASSFIGIIREKEVFSLNDITFTNDSCAGMLRPLNSLISIKFE